MRRFPRVLKAIPSGVISHVSSVVTEDAEGLFAKTGVSVNSRVVPLSHSRLVVFTAVVLPFFTSLLKVPDVTMAYWDKGSKASRNDGLPAPLTDEFIKLDGEVSSILS